MGETEIIKTYNEGIDAIITLIQNMNDGLTQKITSLEQENIKLNNRIAELEARLNKNSNNSSKPPSSDNHKKPRNSRTKTGKPTGGQPGHEGKTLLKVENPDEIVDIKPSHCQCGCDLSHVKGTVLRSRQVFEAPIIQIKVTEFRTNEVICPDCNMVHTTEFPKTVTQPVQYGENMQALIAYLTEYQLIPLERATEIIKDLTGHTISQGTIINVNSRLEKNLNKVEVTIKELLKTAEVVHFDESGLRCEGKTKWLHNASTEQLTHYTVHDKRGAKATNDIGILPEFKGTAVHDHWKAYYTFTDCTHAECNAHHIRNLKGIYENFGHEWAQNMASLLIEIKRDIDNLKAQGIESMDKDKFALYTTRYDEIIAQGKEEDSLTNKGLVSKRTGKPKRSEALKLLDKLEKFNIETLSFMYDFNIPFDNNLAERDIRMMKLKQKISGCFRQKKRADGFCRIRGYISTCRKNGEQVFESLVKAIKGEPFIPQRA